jgi:hypothetical protein
VLARWSPISGHLLPLGYAALLRASEDPELGLQRLDDAAAYLREQALVCAYCGMAFRVAAAIAAARAHRLEQAAAFSRWGRASSVAVDRRALAGSARRGSRRALPGLR